MPDDEKTIPGTPTLTKEATTAASDRAKRISSLTGKIDQLQTEENKKRLQISDEISSLTKEQQKIMRQLELSRHEFSTETTGHMNNIMGGISRAVRNLSEGVKTVTVSTAKATSDAIKQYGSAISEDISINKTNTIAMALSRATPLFGYFAAKFMETDVFKSAATNIRDTIGSAAKKGLTAIGKPFRRKEEEGEYGSVAADIKDIKGHIEEGGIPQLQRGGYIKEGGMIEVHAAEVVTPVDKLLKQMDQATQAKVAGIIQKQMKLMSRSVVNLETLVNTQEERTENIIETFLKELDRTQKLHQLPWQDRLLKAILDLRVGMLGMTNRFQLAWRRTLIQHPTMRNLIWIGKTMRDIYVKPITWLFGIRGKYASDVKGASATPNVFQRIVNVLALIYTRQMPKLDQIIQYNRETAEFLTGKKISPIQEKRWTMFQKIREFMTTRKLKPKTGMESMAEKYGLDLGAMKEAGFEKGPFQVFKSMGITPKDIMGKFFEENKWARSIRDYLSQLVGMKKEQEEREGPHSPSMAQNIAASTTATITGVKKRAKDSLERNTLLQKISKHTKEHGGILGSMWFTVKKAMKGIGGWLLFAFGFLKDALFGVGGGLMEGLGALGELAVNYMIFGRRGGGKGGVGIFTKLKNFGKGKKFKGFGRVSTRLKAFSRAASRTKMGRFLAGGKGMAGRGLGSAAKFAGRFLGGATGVVMLAINSMAGLFKAKEWGTTKMGGMMGAALGGLTEGGLKGALTQAMLGAAIGSIFPGPGTIIGAVAGAIFGFVGGKRMGTMFDSVGKDMVKIFKVVKNLFMLPFRSIFKLYKDANAWVQIHIRDPIFNWMKGVTSWILDSLGPVGKWIRSGWAAITSWWDKSGINMGWIQDQAAEVVKHILFPWTMLTDSLKAMKVFAKAYLYETPFIGGLMKFVFEDLPSDKDVTIQGLIQRMRGKEPHYNTAAKAAASGAAMAKGEGGGAAGYSDIARTQIGRAAGVRQHGGLVGKDSPYLVGEQGPEYFIPTSAGQIIPMVKELASMPGRMFNRSILGRMLAQDALGGTEATIGKLDELKDKVGEFVDQAGTQLGAVLMNNTNMISSSVSNAVSNVSRGGQAIGNALVSQFSSGNASVAEVANCNIS